MPVITGLNVTLKVGHSDILRSNPQDAGNNPTTPTANYAWSADDPSIVSVLPQDGFLQNCKITGLKIGTTRVLAENHPAIGDEIQVWNVTVTAGDYDHDAPSADVPV